MRYINYFFCISFLIFTESISAQVVNCTVNAGIGDGVFCAGDPISLDGNMAGPVVPGTLQWQKISGPACLIQEPGQLHTLAVPSAPGTYVFQISATCASGTATQTVTHVVEPDDNPDAGPDQTVACYNGSGIILTGFSIPPPGTLASWEVAGASGYVAGGVFFPNVCNGSSQTYTLTYVVENANHCRYTDTKNVTVQQSQIAMVADSVSGGCGSPFVAYGSCPGNGTGQWSFVSPAGGATFSNPTSTVSNMNNLIPGQSYTIRWTVTGGCSGGGSADVSFTYPYDNTAPTPAAFTNLAQIGYNQGNGVYLCGAPDSILVFGSQPNPAAHEMGIWSLNTQPCDPFLGTNTYPPNIEVINEYTALVHTQGPGAFNVIFTILDTIRGCYTTDTAYFELEAPGEPITYTATFASCGGKELSPYNYGCSGISVTSVVWDPQDIYSTYPISFNDLPDPGTNLRYILKAGTYTPVAAPPGNVPAITGGNCVNYTLHDFEYVLALNNSAPSGTYLYNIPMVYGNDISPCGNPTASIVMEVSTPPVPSNAGSDLYLCDTQTALAGNNLSSPQWFLINKSPANATTPVITNELTANASLSGMSYGATYYFGYRSYGGLYCNSITDTVVVRTAQGSPSAPNAGPNQTNVCYGMPVLLSATPNPVQNGTSGTWRLVSPVSGTVVINNPYQPVTTVDGLAANTTYTFEYKVKNGCDSLTDQVTVTTNNNQGPALPDAGDDICLGLGTTSVTLSGSAVPPGMTGQWISATGNPTTATFSPASNPNSVATVNGTGNYSLVWQITKAGCGSVRDTVLATISTAAVAHIEEPFQIICNVLPPISITLSADPLAGGTGTWSLYDGNPSAVINSPSSPVTTVSNIGQGAYRFYWSVQNGACTNGRDSIAVYVGIVPPIASVSQSSVTLCGNSNGEITLGGNNASPLLGFWSVEPVSPNIMSAGIASYLNGTSMTTPNATVRLRPGKTRLRWNILPAPPCASVPSVADMIVDYVPQAQIVPNEDTIHICNSSLVSLNAISPGSSGTGTWTKISGPSVYGVPATQQDNNPLIIGLTGGLGVYKFRYQVVSAGCPLTEDFITVVNDSVFTAPYLGPDTSLCVVGDILLSGSNLPSGAFEATWTKVSGPSGGAFMPDANAQEVVFGPVQNGVYLFQYSVSNGGCTYVDFVRDTILLATPFAGPDTIVCATSIKLLTATGGKKWKVQANNPAPATIHPFTGQVNGMSIPGDYFFIMTDTITKCEDIVEVQSKPAAQITQEPAGFTACVGGADTITVSANNNASGMTYQWQLANAPNGPFSNVGTPLSTTDFIPASLTAGTYYYRALADNGACKDTSVNAIVQVLPELTNFIDGDTAICPGQSVNLVSSPTGASAPYQYSWQTANAAGGPWSIINGANQANYLPPGTTTGTVWYRLITSTPVAGCRDTSAAVFLTVKPLPNAVISTNGNTGFCDGGSLALTGSSGAGYSWQWFLNNGAINGATNATYTAAAQGNYTLQTTFDGCSASSTPINITEFPLPNAVISANGNTSLCSGQNDEVILNANSGSSLAYQWLLNNNAISGASNATYTATQVGTYSVIVTNTTTGCKDTSAMQEVMQATTPDAVISFTGVPEICAGQNFPLNGPSGSGMTYQWLLNGSNIGGASQQQFLAAAQGNYSLVVQQNGCIDTSTVVALQVNPLPVVNIVASQPNPVCAGISVVLNAGTGFSGYNWSVGGTSNTINVTASGTFVVTVTDANTCSNTDSYTVSIVNLPTIALAGTDTTCAGSPVILTLSTNAPDFNWNDGNNTELQRSFTPLSTSTYSVTVTDNNDCSATVSLIVTVFPSPDVTLTGNNTICEGETLVLIAQGADNYYTWIPAVSTTDTATLMPSTSTVYHVTGVNSFNCSDTDSLAVEVLPAPDATVESDRSVCLPGTTIVATLPPTGDGIWYAPGNVDIEDAFDPITEVANLQPGNNVFIWEVSNAPCTLIAYDTLNIYYENRTPRAVADQFVTALNMPVSGSVLMNDTIQVPDYLLELIETAPTGQWSLSPDGILNFQPDQDAPEISTALYRLCNDICPALCDSATIEVINRTPTNDIDDTIIITPDGNSKNDKLIFDYLDRYPDNEIVIYNRWGSIVHGPEHYDNDWAGTGPDGGDLPQGTYYYILRLSLGEGDIVYGNILLIR